MNIHEYQGKEILKSFGVAVQEGVVAHTVEQAVEAAKKMKTDYNSDWVVIKAQIHAGGRGKGGGRRTNRFFARRSPVLRI